MTTPAELKLAYRLVVADLYQQFLKMKPNQSLRLNKLGKFTKREVQAKSGLDGNTYIYYRFSFIPFKSLKVAFNQSLTEQHALR